MQKTKVLIFFPVNSQGGIEKVIQSTRKILGDDRYDFKLISIYSDDGQLDVLNLGLKKNISNKFIFKNVFKLRNEVIKYSPDKVITFHPLCHIIYLLVKLYSRFDFFWVASEHGDPERYFKSSVGNFWSYLKLNLYIKAINSANITYTINSFLKNKIEVLCKIKECKLIYNPVSMVPFSIDKTSETKEFKLVTCSRLIKSKNVDLIIKAVKILNDDGFHITLDVIGDGPEFSNLTDLVKQNDVSNLVFMNGKKNTPYTDYYKYHCFISASSSEGMPISLLEAALTRTLIISSNFCGIGDFFEDGCTALLFENMNINALCQKIKEAQQLSAIQCEKIINKSYQNISDLVSESVYKSNIEGVLNNE